MTLSENEKVAVVTNVKSLSGIVAVENIIR